MSLEPGASASQLVPKHVAIIMDGNGRWAQQQGLSVSAGHKAGIEGIRKVLRASRDAGVKAVTLYAFSSENWQRPTPEVNALMRLFSGYIDSETRKLHEDGVRMRFIGKRDRFSKALLKQMDYAEQLTRFNREFTLVIAVDYGGHWDITNAARKLAEQVERGELRASDISEEKLDYHMAMADMAKPDLCIRTANEHRISNFLLWQLAYAEFYFCDVLWPDFDEAEMNKALQAYAQRDRRFGGRPGALEAGNSHA